MIPAGELNKRITLQAPIKPTNKLGAATTTYQDWREVYAKVRPLSNTEFTRYLQVQVDASYEISIRYLPEVSDLWRVKYKNQSYNIKRITNVDERNENLVMVCSHVSSGESNHLPANIHLPEVEDIGESGEVIYQVSNGTWTGNPTYSYQWYRIVEDEEIEIEEADTDTYAVSEDDEGSFIFCTVTATNQSGSAEASTEPVEVEGD